MVEKNYQGKIVDFYSKKKKEDTSLKPVGYYVKQNRGKLLNELIKRQVETIDQIKEINLNGYLFNEVESFDSEFYFIKPFKK